MRLVYEPADLRVDQFLRPLRSFLHPRDELSVLRQHRDRADRIAHAPAADHLASDLGELADVGLRPGRALTPDELVRSPAAESDLDPRPQVVLVVAEAVGLRRRESD